MNAADRVAALREEYARLGEPVDHLTDAELLNREVERTQKESRRHENAYSSLLQDQVKHDRSVYAAARREAADQQIARGGLYLGVIVRRAATPITGLLYRISQLPDRPAPKVVEELRSAARRAQWTLDGVVTDKVLDEVAERDPEVKLAEAQAAEIQRLRSVLVEQGQRLHRDHADLGSHLGRCECPGCELIRVMDGLRVEPATEVASAS
ncbi:hypothetical protein [Streptomyces echinatus]|uniref:Uncharacterized protein n=1 Tax=Streptomyces echinatus TaxID=67293 RepID=A0A7W9UV67_9ACTN|nr:hypothetical protein [Streptomyces echinatus]MBB5932373.1 hypothetical protein [Streptomyces echinatus]